LAPFVPDGKRIEEEKLPSQGAGASSFFAELVSAAFDVLPKWVY
jgi:hypothetical protein